ncbi:carboxypeptidase-like regulatory domain-containing protein [Aureliella helgolandensis]|uniref:Carboxypeptidase regulatory-like domain-containing protein n=1 Tax=Aureliella helgolandensis TaxID=2527968 RepID=A0A518GH16_9BACT|nr:carboxypeptidase-like regulatory domain-containing protein [Aureliella helgolandensis]QDV27874.1 hypothetical protein Q31a_62670 [Aureliella helgolandensis]
MFSKSQWSFSVLLVVVAVGLSGCSSGEYGQVTGTVLAGGEPLKGALLEYYPKAGGSASSARTDENGRYELVLDRDNMGALIGEHTVKITTFGSEGGGDYGAQESPETLPAKYNVASELFRTVTGGTNVIDFELDYEGQVVQPPGAGGGRY